MISIYSQNGEVEYRVTEYTWFWSWFRTIKNHGRNAAPGSSCFCHRNFWSIYVK